MATTIPKPKAPRATWRDWAPDAPEPAELLTREELLDRLDATGTLVTANQLRYWQAAGLVPYPIKRRRGQAVYGYYPPWMIEFIRSLRDLQARKFEQPVTPAGMRARAAHFVDGDRSGGLLVGGVPPELHLVGGFPPELDRRLVAIANEWGGLIGQRVRYVEVRLVTGQSTTPLVFGTPISTDDTPP